MIEGAAPDTEEAIKSGQEAGSCVLERDAVNFDQLLAGFLPSKKHDLPQWQTESVRQKPTQRFIGTAIQGWRPQFYLE